ncbi:MAG: MFS transporter [Arsenophonus endosymbiont of Dermacentor nuttalli]
MNDSKMTPKELKATWGLGAVFTLRMLGMFMVLPILTSYGQQLKDASEFLLGLAIGIYGISQAIFQIPFGLMSDRFGLKQLIINGLLIFIAGSVIAALTDSIWGIIIGRALQGAGAISAAIMALLSDLTSEQNRTKAMAFMGISFGITFSTAIILGPIITHAIGLHGLFWAISLFALGGILIIRVAVPDSHYPIVNRETNFIKNSVKRIINNSQLLKLNFGIFCLHSLLMANFVALPLVIIDSGLPANQHWKIYLGTLLVAFVTVLPFVIYAEKRHRMKQVFLICISILFISELTFCFSNKQFWLIVIGLQLFFIAFNVMEALLPSLISKEAPAGYKGTAMGLYSTSQFLGVALGGIVGGWLFQLHSASLVFMAGLVVCACWFVISLNMHQPSYTSSIRLILPQQIKDFNLLQNQLMNEPGVNEVMLDTKALSAYIKIDKKIINRQQLETIIKNQ